MSGKGAYYKNKYGGGGKGRGGGGKGGGGGRGGGYQDNHHRESLQQVSDISIVTMLLYIHTFTILFLYSLIISANIRVVLERLVIWGIF